METEDIVIPLVSVLAAGLLAFISAMYWTRRAGKVKADAELSERIKELERQALLVATAVQPISAAMQKMLIEKLTHFHTPTLDALLVKLGPPNTLTNAEERKMFAALKRRMWDMNGRIDDAERIAAEALPLIIQLVKLEAAADPAQTDVKFVAVPKAADEQTNN